MSFILVVKGGGENFPFSSSSSSCWDKKFVKKLSITLLAHMFAVISFASIKVRRKCESQMCGSLTCLNILTHDSTRFLLKCLRRQFCLFSKINFKAFFLINDSFWVRVKHIECVHGRKMSNNKSMICPHTHFSPLTLKYLYFIEMCKMANTFFWKKKFACGHLYIHVYHWRWSHHLESETKI